MSAENKPNQAGLDNWLGKTFCPAVESTIDRINVPSSWVTDLSEGRQTSLNSRNDLRNWIKDRVEKAEKVLDRKNIDIEEMLIKPGMDFDDPINRRNSAGINTRAGFKQAYNSITIQNSSDVLTPVIISGRDHNFLNYAVEKLIGLEDIEYAGENGCVYQDNGDMFVYNGDSYCSIENPEIEFSAKAAFDREIWRKAAEEDRKIIWANSLSPVSGTLSVEGEGINLENGGIGIREHQFYSNEYTENSNTDRIWESIEAAADAKNQEHGFERESPLIVFEDTEKNAEILSLALNVFSPGAELRFTDYEGKIAFYPCPEADEDFGDKERKHFLDEVVKTTNSKLENSFEVKHYTDGWTDYMLSGISKQKTAEAILEKEKMADQETLLTYVGDSVVDVFEGENTLFFAQIGRPSKSYCEENDVEYVAINNAVDYCLVIAELIHRHKVKKNC